MRTLKNKTAKAGKKLPAASKKAKTTARTTAKTAGITAPTGFAGMLAAIANAYLTVGVNIAKDPTGKDTAAASALATRYLKAALDYATKLERAAGK
jgi:hypothetical protein